MTLKTSAMTSDDRETLAMRLMIDLQDEEKNENDNENNDNDEGNHNDSR